MAGARRRKTEHSELSDEALAALVRDLAIKEEETLQALIDAVLNDDHDTAKRLAKEMRTESAKG